MQTLTDTVAKGVTKEEFEHSLSRIAKKVNDNWPQDLKAMGDEGLPIFMYDGPSFHNITEEHIQSMIDEGLIKYAWQLKQAPRYSGDFMQCVEHAHAIIAAEWWFARLTNGCELEDETQELWQQHEEQLYGICLEKLSADSVAKNVEKVQVLLQAIVDEGTGEYPFSKDA